MTAEEKRDLASFLDLAADYLRDGYRRPREPYNFAENSAPEGAASAAPAPLPDLPGPDSPDTPEGIAAEIRACAGCSLAAARTRTVPGEGVSSPLVLVVGEGPGADEDAAGRPFVGRAGQYLDRMLASVALSRERNCFIANTVKCRPPENRDPLPEEGAACLPYLLRQIKCLKPLVILCAGKVAANRLLGFDGTEGIGRLRGRFHPYEGLEGYPESRRDRAIPLLCTYHPSAVLRDQGLRLPVWEDLKLLKAKLSELDEAYAAESAAGPAGR
ncbi:MAG: uracil-DNA glycosylase [Treponema sp.]|jgi:DNA polymerase|nr:uracil-DNA glycosylase [Treponema sp.]